MYLELLIGWVPSRHGTRRLGYVGRIKPTDWIALAGVLTALITAALATIFAHGEAVDLRQERRIERQEALKVAGRTVAQQTLGPLFAFVSDLEKGVKAVARDEVGFARYAHDLLGGNRWTNEIRPLLLGLQASSDNEDLRAAARRVVALVDDAIASSVFELEYLSDPDFPDMFDVEAATRAIVAQVAELRSQAEKIAEILRSGT